MKFIRYALPRKGYYNMYNFYMVKMFGISSKEAVCKVRREIDTARNIFTKNVSLFVVMQK